MEEIQISCKNTLQFMKLGGDALCSAQYSVIQHFMADLKGQAQRMQLSLSTHPKSLPEADILNFGVRILKLGVYFPLVKYM